MAKMQHFYFIPLTLLSIQFAESQFCEDINIYTVGKDQDTKINELLEEFNEKLSSHDIQMIKSTYAPEQIPGWEKETDYAKLLEKIQDPKLNKLIKDHFEGQDNWSSFQVQRLVYMLNLTLKRKIKIHCSRESIVIEGPIVSLKNVNKDTSEKIGCDDVSLENIESLKIYAHDTLFIDESLDIVESPFKRLKKITFIAPKWVIEGARSLNMRSYFNAPGAVFLGVTNEIVDSQNLDVIVECKVFEDGSKKAKDVTFIDFSHIKLDEINKPVALTGESGRNKRELSQIEALTRVKRQAALIESSKQVSTSDTAVALKSANDKPAEIKPHCISLANSSNEFQHYFRLDFQVRFKELHKTSFLKDINKFISRPKYLNLNFLIQELEMLENDTHSADQDFSQFYQLLLDKIESYYVSLDQKKTSKTELFMLGFLYTSALSRKTQIQQDSTSGLIVRVPTYLRELKRKFDVLSEMITENNQLKLKSEIRMNINKRKLDFNQKMENRIMDAKRAIDTTMKLEIDKLHGEFNNTIDDLLREVEKRKEDAERNEEQLREAKKSLLWTAGLQSCLGILKIVAVGLSFAGPIGMAAGAVLGAAASVGDSLVESRKANERAKLNKIKMDQKKEADDLRWVGLQVPTGQ